MATAPKIKTIQFPSGAYVPLDVLATKPECAKGDPFFEPGQPVRVGAGYADHVVGLRVAELATKPAGKRTAAKQADASKAGTNKADTVPAALPEDATPEAITARMATLPEDDPEWQALQDRLDETPAQQASLLSGA